jgi:hypothetical protein
MKSTGRSRIAVREVIGQPWEHLVLMPMLRDLSGQQLF